MTQGNDLLKPTTDAEKTFNRVLLVLLIFTVLVILCYEIIGTSIIKAAYEGKSLRILNEAIKFQYKKPVAHYINFADDFFYKALFTGLAAMGFLVILTRLIFFKNILKPVWIIIWGVFLISGVYWLNPDFRIFSFHGLMHSGVVYEIMHGNIPPQNPLVGGQPLLYPWGHTFLAAMISKSLNISPPWAFAAINVFSYIGIAYFVFKVSNLLIRDSRANSFSILTAIFCSTYVAVHDYHWLRVHLNLFLDHRAVPIYDKLLNANGVPVGFLFYMIFIYVLLLIFTNRRKYKILLLFLLTSVAGVGFFYFQLFPGLLGSFAIFFSVKVLQYLRNKNGENLRKIILTSIAICLGTLVILPYALSFTANASSKVILLNPVFMWHDFSNFLLLSVPILFIILANHKNLKKLNGQSLINLTTLFAGAFLAYICVHLPKNNDYKFLIQATVLLGIIGGICVSFMCTGKKRILVLLTMLLLARPVFKITRYRAINYWAPTPGEIGTRLVTTGQEAELYEWILNNTSREDMFIDTKLSIPCMGQRQLFIAIDEYHDNQRKLVPGYFISMEEMLTDVSLYSPELLEYRWRMLRKIYDPQVSLDDEELRDLFTSNDNLLIVTRQQDLQNKFDTEDFKMVFLSSENDFAVFKYNGPRSDDSEPL